MAKTTKKATPRKRVPWNASEILYAVTGYLTTRKEVLIFGADYECSAIAEVIGKIATANGLPKPRDKYPKIHIPDGLDHLTNVPKSEIIDFPKETQPAYNEKAVKANPVAIILDIIRNFTLAEQNDIFRGIAKQLEEDRKRNIDILTFKGKELQEEHEHARKVLDEFLSIVK